MPMIQFRRHRRPALPPEPQPSEWAQFTDLAAEQYGLLLREAPGAPNPPGIETRVKLRRDLRMTWIHIKNAAGSAAMQKPQGVYVTLDLRPEAFTGNRAKSRLVQALAGELADLTRLRSGDSVLVAGLGNRAVIYDALGPKTLDRLWITGHLNGKLPEALGPIRPVYALEPGVLGRTGMETGTILHAVIQQAKPAALLAVDALAARNRDELGGSIQLTNTGICPGSGILSGRAELTRESLGIPVFALGVPILSTLAQAPDYVVTHRAVLQQTAFFTDILARAINLCLHPQLTEEQIAQLVEAK